MSLTIGIPNAAGITIGGKTATTIRALSEATDSATQALGTQGSDTKQVRTGPVGLGKASEAQTEVSDSGSVAQKVLLKRMKELQEQLREQQQQLAAAQAASYPTPEAKTTAVMAIQGQIAETNGALMEVAASLLKEMAKGSGSGSMVNTTA
ncbi:MULTISPECIES: hypothetical protein [unclassified Pseudomonas]|uniref:Uncharacterized protein n=1 Tax=Pseudomonas sp. MYb327 TaxID=2745230 RepID=A0AAU8ED61_9PSED